MPVQVEQEQLEPCRVALSIQVPPEEVQKAVQTVFNQVAKRTTVPGFRPGKAPAALVKRYIDEGRVREMALERAVTQAYNEALKQAGVTPYGPADPKVEFPEEELDPEKGFTFKATVATEPRVTIGDLEGLTARKVVVTISDEDVEKELLRYREAAATFEATEEGAEDGDRVRGLLTIQVEGEDEPEVDGELTMLQIGANLDEVDAGLRGIKAGEERTFTFTYPQDEQNPERQGRTATATMKAEEVLRRTVPEADDELAKGAGFETLEELRARIREMLQAQADVMAEQEVNDQLIDAVVKRAEVHYPDEMVEIEVSDRLRNIIQALERRSLTLDDYLRAERKDLSQLQGELREQAVETVRNTLALLQLANDNNITLTQKDVEEEIKRRAEAENVKVSQMRRLLTDTGEIGQIRNRLFVRKITAFLREKAEITEAAA
jgi:trigger factor